ncbi:GNAT family N-acetyltransferase [Flavivirga eckloniae]|uniref:N-acetyltransferase n=1 Tax=Flavivirga eckloniae TaxID=1803846 RepID=A0A2K9PR73_9FLAO|nr:GNAT family N-acetyltransferase [Flavivirga eckloniae]AUP79573.1 N-acetyltransferase [Flavivirga eckloniae]
MKIDVLKQTDLNSNLENQVAELFKQLSQNKEQIKLNDLLVNDNQITMVYCEENEKIIGMASMCNYRVISGKKGWIEDVVVDSSARGKGIGRKLMEKLLEVAKQKKLTEVLLFTEDHRVSAINLYNNLGFKQKESKIYSIKKTL